MSNKSPSQVYREWQDQFHECSMKGYLRKIDRASATCQHPDQQRLEYCHCDSCIVVNRDDS